MPRADNVEGKTIAVAAQMGAAGRSIHVGIRIESTVAALALLAVTACGSGGAERQNTPSEDVHTTSTSAPADSAAPTDDTTSAEPTDDSSETLLDIEFAIDKSNNDAGDGFVSLD